MSDLLAGLVQGFAQSQRDRLDKESQAEIRKLQVKMFQRQLDMQEEAKTAKEQLIKALAPVISIPEPPVEGSQQTAANLYPQQTSGLKNLLQTGEGQALALKAGIGLGDIKKYQQQSLPELLASLQTQAAMGGKPGAGTAPGMGAPGGLNFSGLEVDAEGNPKVKFDTSTVKNWAVGPDGRTEIGYDQNGRPVAQRPAGPDKRAEEDKPLGVTGAAGMTNAAGVSPPPTMTVREATANGFKIKEDKVQLSDSARLSLANEGAKNLQQVMTALVTPDGKVRKSVVLQMDAPGGGVGQGRELNQLADTAIAGQILLQSGVAVRPEEVENLRRTYIPTTMDFTREGLAERKLARFKALLEGNIDMASLPPSIKARVQERRNASQSGSQPGKVIDFNQLPK